MKYILIISFVTLYSCTFPEEKSEPSNNSVSKTEADVPEKENKTDIYNVKIDAAVEITVVNPWRYGSRYSSSSSTVNVQINICNLSSKIVKYVYFTVRAYNGVDDYIGIIGVDNEYFTELNITGPLQPIDPIESKSTYEEWIFFRTKPTYEQWKKQNYSVSGRWENVWDNSTIVGVEAKVIKIDFIDGTSLTGSGKTIKGEMEFRVY